MADFTLAQPFVAKWEGGLVNHPADPGGLTNFGISLRFLRDLGHDVDGDGDVDAADIKALTPAGAADLLKQEFWTCQDLDSFPSLTAIAHYDASVNCGRYRAVKLLQSACNAFPGPQIKEDGKIGPRTRARVASLDDKSLAEKCVLVRQDFYRRLAVSDQKFQVFLKGWLNRTADLLKYMVEVGVNVSKNQNVPPAQAQSAAPVLSSSGDGNAVQKGVEVGGKVGEPVLSVAGVTLSKKLCVAILGLLAVLLNKPLSLGLSDADVADLVKLLSSYLVGQSAVDAFKPVLMTLVGRK